MAQHKGHHQLLKQLAHLQGAVGVSKVQCMDTASNAAQRVCLTGVQAAVWCSTHGQEVDLTL